MTQAAVKVLDNINQTTVIATVSGITNAKVYEELNGRLSCSFDIVPLGDADKIAYPNIIEIENNFFLVREIRNARTSGISKQVSLEHISYELNDNPNEKFEGKIYTGTPTQILGQILTGTRFKVGTVAFTQTVDFYTEAKELRSRIIEFSIYIGAELKWDKFEVSLVVKRGIQRGIKLEVGKNILSLTEIISTTQKRTTKKSYEVNVVDLNYVVDKNNVPLELHSIDLGDSTELIDHQLGINKTDRVIAIEYDPFQKALPTIEFENSIEDYITSSKTADNRVAVVMFDKVNEVNVTLTTAPSIILYQDVVVVRPTYFDVSSTVTINVTVAGVFECYFMLSGVRRPQTYKQTIPVGFHTIALVTLISGVQAGTHSFNFFASFTGSATIVKDNAQLNIRSTGALGGVTNERPDQHVSDIITPKLDKLAITDKTTVIQQLPIVRNPQELIDVHVDTIEVTDNQDIWLMNVDGPVKKLSEFAITNNYSSFNAPAQPEINNFITQLHQSNTLFKVVTIGDLFGVITTTGTKLIVDLHKRRLLSDGAINICYSNDVNMPVGYEYFIQELGDIIDQETYRK